MKDRMTVNIDAELKKFAKIESINLGLDLGQFIELLLKEYKKKASNQ